MEPSADAIAARYPQCVTQRRPDVSFTVRASGEAGILLPGDTIELGSLSAPSINRLLHEALIAVTSHLFRSDGKSIVALCVASKVVYETPIMKSTLLTLAIYAKSQELEKRIDESKEFGKLRIDLAYARATIEKIEKLLPDLRPTPFVALAYYANHEYGMVTALVHSMIHEKTLALNAKCQAEVLQALIQSIVFENHLSRLKSYRAYLGFIAKNSLPHTDALLCFLGNVLKHLHGLDASHLYGHLKSLVERLPPDKRMRPYSHLAKASFKLNTENRESENRFLKGMVDIQKNQESIYVFNGLLRGAKGLSSENQLKLIEESAEHLKHLNDVSLIKSHFRALADFVAIANLDIRFKVAQLCLDAADQLHWEDQSSPSQMIENLADVYLPFIGSRESFKDSTHKDAMLTRIAGRLPHLMKMNDPPLTFLDQAGLDRLIHQYKTWQSQALPRFQFGE